MSYGDRLARSGGRVEELGLGALLITDLVNVRYLTGFTGINAMLVVAPGRGVPDRLPYVERAQPLRISPTFGAASASLAELGCAARELAAGGPLGFEDAT